MRLVHNIIYETRNCCVKEDDRGSDPRSQIDPMCKVGDGVRVICGGMGDLHFFIYLTLAQHHLRVLNEVENVPTLE